MTIKISEADIQRLTRIAKNAGFDDVERFAEAHLHALAQQPIAEESTLMTKEELQASLAMIDRSMAEIDAGLGMSVEEARQRTLAGLRERHR